MRASLSVDPLTVTSARDKADAKDLEGEAEAAVVFREPDDVVSPNVILILCLMIFLIKCRDCCWMKI